MLKTIRNNFDRHEARRDRRYPLPPITVLLEGGNFPTVNWSLGGFLLPVGGPDFAAGAPIAGELVLPGDGNTHAFSAEVVRSDRDGTAFHFVDSSMSLVAALDRLIAGRMFRKQA